MALRALIRGCRITFTGGVTPLADKVSHVE